MGIFRGLGRRAERIKQQVDAAAGAVYECADCGEQFSAPYDTCPECGGEDVEAVE